MSKIANIVSFCSLCALLTGASVQASDDRGLYQAHNYISCTQYALDRKLPAHSGRNAADEIYLSGWMSAYNYLTPNTYDIVPGHDLTNLMKWIDQYCQSHPDKGVEAAVLQFITDLYPSRMQQYTPPPQEPAKVPAK